MTENDINYVREQLGNEYKAERLVLAYRFLKEANTINVTSEAKPSVNLHRVVLYIKGDKRQICDALLNSYEDACRLTKLFEAKHPNTHTMYERI